MTPMRGAEAGSRWPLWSLLLYGDFGPELSPATRRADARSRLAIAVFVVLAAAVALTPGLVPSGRSWSIYTLLPPLLAYLGWQRWQYALGLDELARRLYLESFAITYLVVLPLFSLFALLQELAGWPVSPLAIVALEPIRAGVLAWRTRRLA